MSIANNGKNGYRLPVLYTQPLGVIVNSRIEYSRKKERKHYLVMALHTCSLLNRQRWKKILNH